MKKALFSIITICRNEEKRIKSTIESVLNQSNKNYEYILIDGKSTDGTLDIIEKYCMKNQLMQCVSEIDTGIYNAMNKGLSRAEGEYVFFLNTGDLFYSNDVLEKVAEKIRTGDWDIIVGDYVEVKHEIQNVILQGNAQDCVDNLKRGVPLCHQATFARKKLFNNFIITSNAMKSIIPI